MIAVLTLSILLAQASAQQLQTPGHRSSFAHEGDWIVEVIDNIKVLPESRVTMTIRGTTITGRASCNTYRGTFNVFEDRVDVGQLLRTMRTCDPARMSEESDFFATLGRVVHAEVRGQDTLMLTTRDGRTLTARRAPITSQR